jgi:hypothetical protein
MSQYSELSFSTEEIPTPSDEEFIEQDSQTEDTDYVPDSQTEQSEVFPEVSDGET